MKNLTTIIKSGWSWLGRLTKKKDSEIVGQHTTKGVTPLWPIIGICIATMGIWLTLVLATFRNAPTDSVVVADTLCESKYNRLYIDYLTLQQRYAQKEDSLIYERNLRLAPADAVGKISKRYNIAK